MLNDNTNKKYEDIINTFDTSLIINNNNILQKELSDSDQNNEIFLITMTEYNNFTITIYPLDIENFAYEQIFYMKNLGFINFTKLYPYFTNYEMNQNLLLLICIMEYHEKNSSINDLNYFIFGFNEKNNGNNQNLGIKINLEKYKLLEKDGEKLEISYPLKNYFNENSLVNKRNSENLLDNIKNIYENYPEVELSNISDPFYNDICFLFTSDQGTDMTLNDRRNEYYVNSSLCEKNCTIIKIINNDLNPRALCNCNIKTSVLFNNPKDIKEEIESYSVPNIKSFICGKEVFNAYIAKNSIFWIFVIIIIIQIFILIGYILYRKREINKILGLYDRDTNKNIEKISNLDNSFFKYRKISLENNLKSQDQKYQNSQNSQININSQNNLNTQNNLNNKNESSQGEYLSAPLNLSNPPKKKDLKKPTVASTKGEIKINEKDLISGNESTYMKGSSIYNNYNEKNQQNLTDISFDDLKNEEDQFYINNLIRERKMLENNYLVDPILLEKIKIFNNTKNALNPLNLKQRVIYYNTNEDIIYPKQNQILNKNKLKNKNKKNIAKILGGEDILNSNFTQNYSDGENKSGYPKTKKRKKNQNLNKNKNKNMNENINENNNPIFEEEKGILGNEKIIPSDDNKPKDGENPLIEQDLNTNKREIIKNLNIKNSLKQISRNENITLSKSLEKNQKLKKTKEEQKNNDKNRKRLKTEINIDSRKRIITDLVKHGKEDSYPNSAAVIINKKKSKKNNKSNSSIESDFNALIRSNSINSIKPLKIKDKILIKNSLNNKDISNEIDSKRLMLKSQEKGDLNGNNTQNNIEEEKLKQRSAQYYEILKENNLKSSVSELLSTENRENLINDNFILFYWKYFIKREIGFVCFLDKNNTIPYFVRYSCLLFCISFIFLLNCLLFLESAVHKRYINALSGKKNRLGYYFKNEFWITICVALIGNIFKMIIIKLILYKVFKIEKKSKKLMRASSEKGLNQDELEQLQLKRQKFLKDYNRNLIIYFICVMLLNIFIGYICICYGGVFSNSIGAFLYGLLFSLIMSFIFCAIICFLIVCVYKMGKCLGSNCIIGTYVILSTIY